MALSQFSQSAPSGWIQESWSHVEARGAIAVRPGFGIFDAPPVISVTNARIIPGRRRWLLPFYGVRGDYTPGGAVKEGPPSNALGARPNPLAGDGRNSTASYASASGRTHGSCRCSSAASLALSLLSGATLFSKSPWTSPNAHCASLRWKVTQSIVR